MKKVSTPKVVTALEAWESPLPAQIQEALGELVGAYDQSERWAREALEARAETPRWPRDLTIVLAAAFDAYQRGAIDYEP